MTVNNGSTDLYQTLWNSADILRSKMDANEYKNYLLGLIFYKYLSDRLLYFSADLLEEEVSSLEEAKSIYKTGYEDDDLHDDLIGELKHAYSYSIKPKLTFTSLVGDINDGCFELDNLAQALRDIEQSDTLYENLFEDIDLYSKKLGSTLQKQSKTIQDLMKELSKLDFAKYSGDVLGDAYEYLIGQFASESGKKAGEFYTPQAVSHLMTQIAIDGKEDKKGFTAYDPAMGSGSLLLNVRKYSNEPDHIYFYGQEINTSTYNLARMNMILHGIAPESQNFKNGDTLDEDWPTDEPTNFDSVLMNPPYSAKWSADKGFLEDERFSDYGVLPTKSRADYAFLLHGYYHLKTDGVMAIVLPHGVLFRGGAEGKIREMLLRNGAIDTVIGLPGNIFFNTSIPTTVIILKKNRDKRDVLFIDASKEFEKVKTQNLLKDNHIDKILDAYRKRKKEGIEKFAHLADFEEIEKNDFNLNIPRYVDTFEPEPEIALEDVASDINEITRELKQTEKEILGMLGELKGTNEEADEELKDFISQFMKLGDMND